MEVAFDEDYRSGSQRIRLIEVELELKSGNSSGLYDLATRVVLELPFVLISLARRKRVSGQ